MPHRLETIPNAAIHVSLVNITRTPRRFLGFALFAIVLVAIVIGAYLLVDPEHLDLNDSVRRATPGQFVKLTDGSTHYDVGGPASAPVVVLAAGFSVPY